MIIHMLVIKLFQLILSYLVFFKESPIPGKNSKKILYLLIETRAAIVNSNSIEIMDIFMYNYYQNNLKFHNIREEK